MKRFRQHRVTRNANDISRTSFTACITLRICGCSCHDYVSAPFSTWLRSRNDQDRLTRKMWFLTCDGDHLSSIYRSTTEEYCRSPLTSVQINEYGCGQDPFTSLVEHIRNQIMDASMPSPTNLFPGSISSYQSRSWSQAPAHTYTIRARSP